MPTDIEKITVLKHDKHYDILKSIIFWDMILFITTAVKTSNPTLQYFDKYSKFLLNIVQVNVVSLSR
jgi:hypothetical protein